MRLKSFQAKSMHDAMRQVKETLGDEAIIVSTKEESGWVRITAAVEQGAMPPAPPPIKDIADKINITSSKTDQMLFDEDETLEMISDTLLKHRIPANVSDKILTTSTLMFTGDPQKTLTATLEKVFSFEAPQNISPDKPLILVGPPGAGKTLMTAKLATDHVIAGIQPAVITTDIARAGGVEQLSAFLNILELPLLEADDIKTLKARLSDIDKHQPVIIDTGGLNPFDPQEMKDLAQLMSVADMDANLVMPAGIDAEEAAEIAMTFEVLGVKRIIPTRLDFARRLGGILSATDRAHLTFGRASHTPQVANGIVELSAHKLSRLLMPNLPDIGKEKRGQS